MNAKLRHHKMDCIFLYVLFFYHSLSFLVNIFKDKMHTFSLENLKTEKLIRRTYRTNGPYHVIHVDQYDKLANYMVPRMIAWLYVGNNNRNSSIGLHFYLSYIQSIKGIPKIVRIDGGTENSLMLKVHTVLPEHIGNRHPCCIVGRSVHNQRIQRFWRYLRQHLHSVG